MRNNFEATAPLYAGFGLQVAPDVPPELLGEGEQPTSNLRLIRKMGKAHPNAGVRISTGSIVAIDVDPEAGGNETLAGLVEKHGPLPHTWSASGTNGKMRMVFSQPSDQDGEAVALTLAPGIILHGNGDTIPAPSFSTDDGNDFTWVTGATPPLAPLATLPSYLRKLGEQAGAFAPPAVKAGALSLMDEPFLQELIQHLSINYRMGARQVQLSRLAVSFCMLKTNNLTYGPQEVGPVVKKVVKDMGSKAAF
jgi:hypothetical protein